MRIPAGAPVENIHTAVAAARQFGRYPIPERLDRQAFRSPETVPFPEWMRRSGMAI